MFLICSVGGTKAFFGITGEKPTGFLIILLTMTYVVLKRVFRPLLRRGQPMSSQLGPQFLETVENQFSWLKTEVEKGEIPKGINDDKTGTTVARDDLPAGQSINPGRPAAVVAW
jgi:uncharacterized protein (TIGR04222 family)